MSKAEKIKAKIERLKESLPWGSCASQISMECNCKNEAYNEVLSYINSLEEEPVSKDLEEFAKRESELFGEREYEIDFIDRNALAKGYYWGVKAGAQWQKERDQSTIELAEDHAYLAGQEKIIAKACEWLENYFKGVSSGTVYLEDFKKAIKE